MRDMTVEEIKEMVGIEFIYVYPDHSEIPAVIAAFDPKVGFTCLATSLVDSFGDDHSHKVDNNGNLCLIGYDERQIRNDFKPLCRNLRLIKHLGYFVLGSQEGFKSSYNYPGGNAQCSFS